MMDIRIDLPYRGLAAAVIKSAVDDYKAGYYPHANTAKMFLFSESLNFWCALLDIDPEAIREGLR